uniref:Uncharacterized protein n=1 Tax=Anolis carolinensis TaxID=28377 RepID=A0A803TUH9_ANOCA
MAGPSFSGGGSPQRPPPWTPVAWAFREALTRGPSPPSSPGCRPSRAWPHQCAGGIRPLRSSIKVPVEGPVPPGRHSHGACAWEGGVLMAGGLGAAEQPLGSVLFLRPIEGGFRWQTLETFPPLIPRYSHTAHVHRGKLLLVGGVWLHAPSVPGVAVVDLATGQAAEYSIDTVSE